MIAISVDLHLLLLRDGSGIVLPFSLQKERGTSPGKQDRGFALSKEGPGTDK